MGGSHKALHLGASNGCGMTCRVSLTTLRAALAVAMVVALVTVVNQDLS